jgi:hypothetical protein
LSVVAVLLAELEAGDIGRGEQRNLIAGRFERRTNEPLMFPREAAEKNGDAVTFGRCKGPFDRPAKVRRCVARLLLETSAFLRDALLNLSLELLSRFQRFQQQGRLWFEARRSVHEALLDDAHTKREYERSTLGVASPDTVEVVAVRILFSFFFFFLFPFCGQDVSVSSKRVSSRPRLMTLLFPALDRAGHQ